MRNKTSKYIGVHKKRVGSKHEITHYCAQILINGMNCYLGYFDTEREAALAYDKKAIEVGRKTNFLKRKAA